MYQVANLSNMFSSTQLDCVTTALSCPFLSERFSLQNQVLFNPFLNCSTAITGSNTFSYHNVQTQAAKKISDRGRRLRTSSRDVTEHKFACNNWSEAKEQYFERQLEFEAKAKEHVRNLNNVFSSATDNLKSKG